MGLPVGLFADAAGERAALSVTGVAVCVCVAVAWLILTRQARAAEAPHSSA